MRCRTSMRPCGHPRSDAPRLRIRHPGRRVDRRIHRAPQGVGREGRSHPASSRQEQPGACRELQLRCAGSERGAHRAHGCRRHLAPGPAPAPTQVLRTYPEAGLVGSLCDVIDEEGRKVRGPDPWRLRHSGWFAPFPTVRSCTGASCSTAPAAIASNASIGKIWTCSCGWPASPSCSPFQSRCTSTGIRTAARDWIPKQPDRIERATDLMYRCVEALDRGSDYEDLLAERPKAVKVDPRVFRAHGSIVLWSGHRPRLLKRLLQRGELQPDLKTILALGWAGLATLSLRPCASR